ncbi:MAG: HAD-IB family hydrolase [Pseudomonadota bacterium]
MTQITLQDHLEKLSSLPRDDRRVAFFDLDGTLISGYSIVGLSQEVIKHATRKGQLVKARGLVRDTLRQRHSGGGGNYQKLVKRLSRALTGVPEDTLLELGRSAYRNNLERRLYREAIQLVESHRARGDHLVLVTAASRYQAEPIAKTLGLDEICCTRLEVIDGKFTGKAIAPLCYGEGKALAARRVARKYNSSLKHCWFYTDSSADLPLLRQVGMPVAVNPSSSLSDAALGKGWPVLHFSSRGRPGTEGVLRTVATGQAIASAATLAGLGQRLGIKRLSGRSLITRLIGDVGAAAAGLDFEVEGLGNLRQDQACIYVFNHQSLLDGMVLAHLLGDNIVALCKREMADKPFIGRLLKQVDTIFVDRQERDQGEVLGQARAALDSGRSLVIAPEGTRSTLGDIQPFKHGAFYLSRKAGVPIVPIVLHNVKDALPKGSLFVRPATIRISVLPAIWPGESGSIRQSCAQLEERYIQLLRQSQPASLPQSRSA